MNGRNVKVDPDSGAGHEPSQEVRPGRFARLAWLPVLLLLAAIIVARAAGLRESYMSEPLRLVLSFTFYTAVSLGTLFLIGRSFLASGKPGLLLLECGVILWSLAGTVGDLVAPSDPNVNATIFNTVIFLAGLCNLAGAALSLRPQAALRSSPLWLLGASALALVSLWLVAHAALAGWLPVFFIPGQGGTLVRYCVLLSAIAAFVLSAGLMLAGQREARVPFAVWYALAMLSLSVGLFGIMIQLSFGSVVNWLARTAQWLGGLYLLFAAAAALRESNLPLFPPERKSLPERYGYGVAIAIVIAATAARFALSPALGTSSPFLTFYPAVILAALYGGLRAGLLTTVLSALIVDYFWMEPVRQFAIESPTDWITMLLFLLASTMISFAIEAMHKARVGLVLHQDHLEELVKKRTGELEREVEERKQAEETLRQSEERFRTMANALPQLAWIAKSDGYIFWYNQRWYDYTGTTPEEMEGWGWQSVHDPEVLPQVLEQWKGSIATGMPFDMVFPLRGSDGQFRPFLTRVMPLKDASGKVIQWFGTNTDITERKQAEDEIKKSLDAVRRSEEQLQVLMQNVGSAVALIDEAGKFPFINREFLRIFGLDSESDILNINSQDWSRWEVYGEDGKLLHVDDHPVRKAVMTGKPVISQLVAVRNPGANELTWMLINAEPLLREDGTVYRVVSTYHDITERKQIEQELRKSRDELELRVQERTESLRRQAEALSTSEKEFRLLAEAMPQIVWITRADGRNIYFNQQWVDYTGLTLEESHGHGWNKPFHPDDQKRAWDAWQNAVTNNGTYSLECRLRAADGTYRWWLVRGVPVVNEKGETTKWFGTCTDIDEFKRVETQLRQAQKMEALGTLTGGIAHDFNNILAAIIGFAELARDKLKEGSREKRHLQRVFEAGLRGRELVKQMLTFSRKTEQDKKPLQLSTIVKETMKLLRASIPATISIRTDVRSESGLIFADPTQMQQVLMNLCMNGAYAMQEKGGVLHVEISDFTVSESDGNPHGIKPGLYMRLTVRDTGTGISSDIIDKIFDPFFTTKKQGEGTGLGLSVVHGIVNQHDGYISVESESGKGTTFTVYLPKIAEEPRTDAVSDDDFPTGSEHILFVDDEEALVEMGEDILAELGYEVTSRMNSREALALFGLDPSRFDLVITDQTMPEMTGVELAKEILAIKADIPIIMCTGFSHLVDAEAAKGAGIKAFAMKPLTKREIAKTIRKVLGE
jgi:PAS domain S-box-containing protein